MLNIMAIITLEGVSKKYNIKNKQINALNNINLTVEKSSFLVITGASGSGKSTLLQLMGGIDMPTSGQVIIDGQNITNAPSRQLVKFRSQKIGIIFQQFFLEPNLTLRQNIELPAMFLNMTDEDRKKRTTELAVYMGLQEYLDHLPAELSGGQIQRAAIARSIYNNPDILIADEPTSSLDQENVLNIINLFKQIQKNYGTTIIIATHDQGFTNYATQVVKLSNGSIIQ
jgi:putative ABC transport system ATP-binding protein